MDNIEQIHRNEYGITFKNKDFFFYLCLAGEHYGYKLQITKNINGEYDGSLNKKIIHEVSYKNESEALRLFRIDIDKFLKEVK